MPSFSWLPNLPASLLPFLVILSNLVALSNLNSKILSQFYLDLSPCKAKI